MDASVAVDAEVALALPLPLRALVERGLEEEDTPVPTREGVDCGGGKVKEEEAGEVPEEARDLRVTEQGLEAEADTAVAGVTGAEGWVVEEKEVSLRESKASSMGAVAADERRRLLRRAVDAVEAELGAEREGVALAEATVEGPAGAAGKRAEDRALDGELDLARLLLPGMEKKD